MGRFGCNRAAGPAASPFIDKIAFPATPWCSLSFTHSVPYPAHTWICLEYTCVFCISSFALVWPLLRPTDVVGRVLEGMRVLAGR